VAGEEAARLDRACAAAFERAGDQASASIALARTAEHSVRFSGMYANPPPAGAAAVILERARRMVNADARAATAVLAAEAHLADPGDLAASDRAVVRARQAAERVGDAALLSSVLDASTVLHVSRREISQSATVAARRIGPLTSLTDDPRGAFELKDALHMGAFASVGAGDLAMARRLAQQHLELPFTREEGDLAAEDLFTPAALSGDWGNALRLAPQYRHRWERSGRPRAPGRGVAPAAVSLIHGLRGEQAARVRWLGILARIRGVDLAEATTISYGYVFDAILRLQTGHAADALVLLDLGEKNTSTFYDLLFTQWRAALTAEAAVICGLDRAADLVAAAKYSTDGNPVAHTITRRAEAMLVDDRAALVSLAATFGDLSCPYQRARTLVLSGDESKDAADAAMAALGVPPG
jgi:hypothetical protein